jgi:hypothetical protein
MKYTIGRVYKYPLSHKKFKLIEASGFIFLFECGHWCTDNVFMDLIDCETGIQVYKDVQLTIF